MLEALGPMPPHEGDLAAWFMVQGRSALWQRDADGAQRLLEQHDQVSLPPGARLAMESLLRVVMGRTGPIPADALERALPVDASRSPRRASFNAQMRAEHLAFAGANEAALEALEASDRCGLLDLVWLERCPLLHPLRAAPAFVAVAERVSLRARRVLDALDARSFVGL